EFFAAIQAGTLRRREGEPHEAPERAGLNGGEELGVPLAAALPEPIPVPETSEDEAAGEEEAAPDRPADHDHSEPRDSELGYGEPPATEPAGAFYPEPPDSVP